MPLSTTYRRQSLNAPIFKLDDYLLWLIFSETARMDMDLSYASRHRKRHLHPLTVLRRCSHVCSLWRDILLHSPSLWGQLIDIEALLWSHDSWRKEVLSRTGQALLHVKGCIRFDPENEPWKGTGEYFLSLLNEYWPRIRRLRVEVMEVGVQSEEKALQRWRVLQRPAPNLEFFDVHFGLNTLSNLFTNEGNHLFSDNSPYLRHFVATNIKFQLSAPCFAHLKSLQISSYFTIFHILDAFSGMDSLESLTVDSLSMTPGDLPLPYVFLPLLTDVQVFGPTGPCMTLLDHITAAPSCRIFFEAGSDKLPTMREVEATHRVLERYAKNYLETHAASAVSISIHLSSFTFFTNSITTLNDHSSPDFKFRLDVRPDDISFLLGALSQCSFDSVKTLYIGSRGLPTLDSNFIKLFKLLHSIEEVELTPDGMTFLLTTSSEENGPDSPLFPLLKTIRIAPFITASDTDMILPFLHHRQSLGVPMKVFDLALHPLAGFPINFSFLDEIKGMKVAWKSGKESKTYVCGSGRPDELDFQYDPAHIMYDIEKL
ncbi:hypothetical protein BDN70DRAFT_882663 [Pholiota conissans]|uniref:F-box domain-containing protein n=1 Tax=Pholiota conissans TaxID=109636 RepID=A0A9P5YYM3_9AGAR|nr:hypothetical protein BDN70DRAFT_882663 [Pholiota conissans]